MFLQHLPKELITPFLDLVYTMVLADGRIAEEELAVLELYAQEMRVDKLPECKTVDYEQALDAFGQLDTIVKREVFFELLGMAHSDMDVSPEEKSLIDIAARKLGIDGDMRDDLSSVLIDITSAYKRLGKILHR